MKLMDLQPILTKNRLFHLSGTAIVMKMLSSGSLHEIKNPRQNCHHEIMCYTLVKRSTSLGQTHGQRPYEVCSNYSLRQIRTGIERCPEETRCSSISGFLRRGRPLLLGCKSFMVLLERGGNERHRL